MSGGRDAGPGTEPDGLEPEILDERREYTAVELCRVCRLPHERLVEYVAHGVVHRPRREGARAPAIAPDERFTHVELRRLVRAVRVRRELEVELPNLALVLDLLERLADQRRELERLRRETGERSGGADR